MMVVANASVLRCRARGAAGLQASPASPNTTAPPLAPTTALYGGTRGRGGRLRRALPSVPGGPSTGRGRPLDGLVLGGRARSPDEGAAATRQAVAGGGGCLNVGDVNWPRLTGHPQTSNGYG